MNDRKLHVVNMAHQLFIEKGFQATSIQDILDYSGISKGTFYNYFSSKSELLIAIYKTIYKKLEKDRNDLLIGQNPASIEIFIKQVELQMISNRKNKLLALYEEVLASNDADLKQYIKRARLNSLRWYYNRFIDIFGEDKKPFLLDCAIMFQGIIQYNIQYNRLAHESGEKVSSVVRYCVARMVKMVDEVAESGDQLIEPKTLEKWVPDCPKNNHEILTQLTKLALTIRTSITKSIKDLSEQNKYHELLDFIQEEIIHTRSPRKFLIQSAFLSLKQNPASLWKKELEQLDELIEAFYSSSESEDTNP
ncbi:TetR/AcrR family transcriptional regulator [Neobacillus sp. MER 74]|uniref:TetR/AcrR family transcriptional regulator n=1 Tax=Bacillaceae TaxID=186817 RepID=UPI000BF2C070|nr:MULTISPECIES: TetR/AcrR family transcriptional regulator [Bacillaceae]MCM3115615.1 TetR/AcrR family transcriptional regulator [Neobacillus sp. MER 74]PFP31183.1 TetR family transcriptional regulator [Bacillus sp. AFS073361]